MKKCIVCNRVSPKTVFKYAHLCFDGKIDKNTIHKLALESCECINYVDTHDRIFFCGRTLSTILSGLFYILARKYNCRITMKDIRYVFPNSRQYSDNYNSFMTEVTIQHSYRRWYQHFPELFQNIIFNIPNKPNSDQTW
jgi:hypothetical protein